MKDLRAAVEALQRARKAKQEELRAIEKALKSLGVSVADAAQSVDHRNDLRDLGITAATKRYLREAGEARTTREIADALRERGVKSQSKNYIATVYATLHNSTAFKRTDDNRWELTSIEE